jgi:hypothetical protein
MTVKQLIEKLQEFDPETVVVGTCTDPTDFTYINTIESVELGDPIDSNGNSYFEDEDEDKDYDEEYNYIGPKVVLINIGDV